MIRFVRYLAVSIGILFLLFLPVAAQELLITNVRIVDLVKETTQSGVIWVRDGRVHEVLAAAPEHYSGERLDAGQGWLLPALVDLHTHSFGNVGVGGTSQFLGTEGAAKLVPLAGVTALLDLFSAEKAIFALRDRQRAGAVAGARIFAAGPCLTAPKGHCSEYGVPTRIIADAKQAREQVNDLAKARPDVVKVVYDHGAGRLPTIDYPALQSVVATATEHGLKTIVHIGTWDDVRDAIRAGAAAITHLPYAPLPEDIPAALVAGEVAIIPTLAVQTELANLVQDPGLLDRPLLKILASDAVVNGYRDLGSLSPGLQRWLSAQQAERAELMRTAGALARAGVQILVGTDAGNPAVFQGYSVHREMELLVEAGLTPAHSLRAASIDSARFLGQARGTGQGALADFLIVGNSPLKEIRNSQDVRWVIQSGRVVVRRDQAGTLAPVKPDENQ